MQPETERELCLAQGENDPHPCHNLIDQCKDHCGSKLRKKPGNPYSAGRVLMR